MVITDSTPVVVEADLHSTLILSGSIHQLNVPIITDKDVVFYKTKHSIIISAREEVWKLKYKKSTVL